VATKDQLKYLRQYPDGPAYAALTGFYSFIYGSSGLEDAENKVLSGDDPRQFGRQLADLFTGRQKRGGSVVLTINKAAQDAAYQAMKASNGQMRAGAVVALDPTTGAILAAVSTPSFDPNKLSSHDANAIEDYWQSQQRKQNPADPMLNRAFDQLYAPGSVFKVIVSAAALQAGVKPTDQIPAPNYYWPLGGKGPCPASGGACIENFNGETCQNGKTATLAFALAKSCNTAFAELAVKLGAPAIEKAAQAFGFDGDQLNIPMSVVQSTVGSPNVLENDDAALAQTSFGQRDVRVSPLQSAMIAAAVANGGTLEKPYVVQQELGPNLSILSDTKPSTLGQAIDTKYVQDLQTMMEGVVSDPEGTGHAAAINDIAGMSVVVGGKTGTADTGIFVHGVQTPPHAWFSGFALVNGQPKIAVAVIIENGGVNGNETTGGLAAAPVAKAVMEAYLKSGGGH
jgi:peptidoglycan glycosyltransferase